MALNSGAIYEEVSKLTVDHTASFVANTNPDIAPPFCSQQIVALHRDSRYTGGRDWGWTVCYDPEHWMI
jgi:hypothetical protein